MPDSIPPEWLAEPPRILVAGDGPYARALAGVLAAAHVGSVDLVGGPGARIGEPTPQVWGELERVFLVADPRQAAAEILAAHRGLWGWVDRLSPEREQHRLAILFILPDRGDRLEASLALGLGVATIDPASSGHGVARMSDPLRQLLAAAAEIVPRDAVVLANRLRADRRHAALRGLRSAEPGSVAQQSAAKEVLDVFDKKEYDLDLFCRPPCHSNGNFVRRVLTRAVTQSVTPNEWTEMLAKLS